MSAYVSFHLLAGQEIRVRYTRHEPPTEGGWVSVQTTESDEFTLHHHTNRQAEQLAEQFRLLSEAITRSIPKPPDPVAVLDVDCDLASARLEDSSRG